MMTTYGCLDWAQPCWFTKNSATIDYKPTPSSMDHRRLGVLWSTNRAIQGLGAGLRGVTLSAGVLTNHFLGLVRDAEAKGERRR